MERFEEYSAEDLATALGLRNEAKESSWEGLQEMLAEINRKAKQAEGELDSYGVRNVAIVIELMTEAARQNNKEVVEFAKTFANHLLDGGDPESFFEERKHLRGLELGRIIKFLPDLKEELVSGPTSGPLLLGMGEIIEGEEASVEGVFEELEIDTRTTEKPDLEDKIKETPPIKKGEYITDPGMTQREKTKKLTKIYPAINILLRTDSLWEEDPLIEADNTPIDNVAALLVGDDWDKAKLLKAKKAMRQTFTKNWSQVYFEEFETESFGRTILDHGKTTFLSRAEVVHLLWFMHRNLGQTIKRTPYRITKEGILDWPFDTRKGTSISKKKRKRWFRP